MRNAKDRLSNHKTVVFNDTHNDLMTVIYVSTAIVKYNQYHIYLDHGGYMTATTKKKMNQASQQFGLGFTVTQKAGEWFVKTPQGKTLRYEDAKIMKRGN